MGLLSGVMVGVSALTGPVIISYLMSLRLPRDVFVGSVSVIYLSGALPLYDSMASCGGAGDVAGDAGPRIRPSAARQAGRSAVQEGAAGFSGVASTVADLPMKQAPRSAAREAEIARRAVQRGLFRAVAIVVNRGAIRQPLGLPAKGLHARLPML